MTTAEMVTVSKGEFYAAMTGNVSPYFGQRRYDAVTGYTAEWKTPYGELLGVSSGIPHLHNELYMLTPSLHRSVSPKQKQDGGIKLNPEFIYGGLFCADNDDDEQPEPLTQTDYEPLYD